MPGLTGPTWYYHDLYIELDGGSLIQLERSSLQLPGSKLPPLEAIPESAWRVPSAIGETILEAYLTLESDASLYLLLSSGRYLFNYFAPGGNSLEVGDFHDWDEGSRTEPLISFWEGKQCRPWEHPRP